MIMNDDHQDLLHEAPSSNYVDVDDDYEDHYDDDSVDVYVDNEYE